MAPLCPSRLSPQAARRRRFVMFDVLLAVLGTGGILLMAAYVMLCERV